MLPALPVSPSSVATPTENSDLAFLVSSLGYGQDMVSRQVSARMRLTLPALADPAIDRDVLLDQRLPARAFFLALIET